ncbi:Sec61p translocation complex subunit [Ceratobasidium sp. 414]|nr:Sec61p translocation complex subunit [Ceratobasidium sp. 414]
MSDKVKEFVEMPQEFVKEGKLVSCSVEAALGQKTDRTPQFLTRCTKPTQKEYVQICKAVAIGFGIMGFIGYFVKLIHIPINNILVGGA